MNHQNENVVVTGDRIAGIAQSTEAISIRLLNAIDGTVDAMQGIAKIMSGFSTMLCSTAQEIGAKTIVSGELIDPHDVAIDAMQRSVDQLKTFLTKLTLKQGTIDKDYRLKDHHCESLHDAYEEATGEISVLIEELEATRSAIISHDLQARPHDEKVPYATSIPIGRLDIDRMNDAIASPTVMAPTGMSVEEIIRFISSHVK